MSNLDIYEQCREVPIEAQRTIKAGRLRGMTDINPMWRIKKLTELYGPCGVGWYTSNVKTDKQEAPNGEVALSTTLDLYTKGENGEWNAPLFGVGGSMLISMQKGSLYLDDEAWKKAYTDAVSVACKSLGIGANVYWESDKTKYTTENAPGQPQQPAQPPQHVQPQPYSTITCERCQKPIKGYRASDGQEVTVDRIIRASKRAFGGACYCAECQAALKRARSDGGGN